MTVLLCIFRVSRTNFRENQLSMISKPQNPEVNHIIRCSSGHIFEPRKTVWIIPVIEKLQANTKVINKSLKLSRGVKAVWCKPFYCLHSIFCDVLVHLSAPQPKSLFTLDQRLMKASHTWIGKVRWWESVVVWGHFLIPKLIWRRSVIACASALICWEQGETITFHLELLQILLHQILLACYLTQKGQWGRGN